MANSTTETYCAKCPHMKITHRANTTSVHTYRGYRMPRGSCYCTHPDAEKCFKAKMPKSNRTPGFIAFTPMNSTVPDIKTSPRWCPYKFASISNHLIVEQEH